jgi:MFS family permease
MKTLIQWMDVPPIWLLALILFGLFFLAVRVGRTLAAKRKPDEADTDPGLLVSASLGLMALLLGFTVSMAVARYDERRTVMVNEGNAIGTFIYRTDLMPPEQRIKTRAALEDYVAARVDVGRQGITRPELAAARKRQADAQQLIWQEVVSTSAVAPDGSFRILIVGSANEMFDMATTRDIALENRLPNTLIVLLVLFPLASLVLIGYVSDRSGRAHALASIEMILLLTLVLALIADLNRPRRGTIIAPQEAMLAAQDQLRATVSRAASPLEMPTRSSSGE